MALAIVLFADIIVFVLCFAGMASICRNNDVDFSAPQIYASGSRHCPFDWAWRFFLWFAMQRPARSHATYRMELPFYTHFDIASGGPFNARLHELFRHEITVGKASRLRSALQLYLSSCSTTFPVALTPRSFTKPDAMIPGDDSLDAPHAVHDTDADEEFFYLSR